MDGTVLHYDAEASEGIIRASDGNRYNFVTTEWKSPQTPLVGDVVDFEISGKNATGVFVTRRAAMAGAANAFSGVAGNIRQQIDQGRAAAASSGENPVMHMVNQRPGLIAAGIILLASFLPFISIPELPMNIPNTEFHGGGFSLFSVVSWAQTGIAALSAMGVPASVSIPARLIFLLLAIPAMAAYLLYREYNHQADDKLRFRTGLLAAIGPLGIPLLTIVVVLLFNNQHQVIPGGLDDVLDSPAAGRAGALSGIFGFGLVLTMATGIALVAVSKGLNAIKALIGSFIYLFLLSVFLDFGLTMTLIFAVVGAMALFAVLRGWNPMEHGMNGFLPGQQIGAAAEPVYDAPVYPPEPEAAPVPAAPPSPPPAPVAEFVAETPGEAIVATTDPAITFCSQCGHRNIAGDRFCSQCGETL